MGTSEAELGSNEGRFGARRGGLTIDELLTIAAERLASDLHVRAAGPPYLRIDGELLPIEVAVLGAPEVERMAFDLMTEEQARSFKRSNEADFSYTLPGVARF